jgi:hypothetical protein
MAKAGTVFVELGLDATQFTKAQKDILQSSKQTALDSEKNFKTLGTQSDLIFNTMRENAKSALGAITASTKSSAEERIRAERAAADQIASINRQQFGEHSSLLDKFKTNWVAASAVVVGAIASIHKAHEIMKEGAKAIQIESSFKILAEEAGADAEKMIAAMKKGTRGAIEESDLMQKANKAMLAGYDPEQIVQFTEVVIAASQYMGTNVTEAYEKIIDSLATRMPKAMVAAGAIIADQKTLVKDAMAAGATQADLMALAIANLALKTEQLKGTQDEAIIAMQRHEAQMKEMKETVGKGLIIVFTAFMGVLDFVASGFFAVVYGMQKFNEVSANVKAFVAEMVPGFEAYAKQQREIAKAYGESAAAAKKNMEELDKAGRQKVGLGDPEKEKLASAESLKTARERVKAEEAKMKAIVAAGKASEEANKQAEQAEKSIAEAIRRAAYEKDTINSTQEVKDLARMQSEADKYAQLGASKISVEKFVAAEKALITAKAEKLAYDVQSTAAAKAADDAIAEMKREIDEGMKGGETYRKMKAEEYDFAATENERAINAIIAKEQEKIRILDELRGKDMISVESYATLKAQVETNATKAIIEKTTENNLKIAKGNADLIRGIRGLEGQAYQDRVAEIRAQADVYAKEGLERGRIALWVAEQEKEAYRQMALASNDWAAGVSVALDDLMKDQTTWAEASAQMTKELFTKMEGFASDIFFKAITGELKDFDKMFEDLWKGLLKTFCDIVTKMIVQWLVFDLLLKGTSWAGIGGSAGSSIGGAAVKSAGVAAYEYFFGAGGTAAAAYAANGGTLLGAGTGAGAGAGAGMGASIGTTGASGGTLFTGAEASGATAATTTGAGSATMSSALAAAGPYIVAAVGAYVTYKIIEGVSDMATNNEAMAKQRIVGGMNKLSSMYGDFAGQDLDQWGASAGMPVKAISEGSSDAEKMAFIQSYRKEMRLYGEEAKLTADQVDSLVREALGPANAALLAGVDAAEASGQAIWDLSGDFKSGQETTQAYKDSVLKIHTELDKATDPVKALTDTLKLNASFTNQAAAAVDGMSAGMDTAQSAGMNAAAAVQLLSDTIGLSASQAATLTSAFEATNAGTMDVEESINKLANTLNISQEAARDLATALKLIPTNINATVTMSVPSNAGISEGSAAGGWITGGSGVRDDVFLGMTPGVAHYGMGGEFVVKKSQAKKYSGLLNYINRGHADGGPISPEDYEAQWWAMRIALFEAAGDTANATKFSRQQQMKATTPGLEGLQEEIYAWEDWNKEQEEERNKKKTYFDLNQKLLTAMGLDEQVLYNARQKELEGMDPMAKAIYKQIIVQENLNKANEIAKKAEEDLAKAREAAAAAEKVIADRQYGLTDRLLQAQGKDEELLMRQRNKEISEMTLTQDSYSASLLHQIYAAEDATLANEKALTLSTSRRGLDIELMVAQGKEMEALTAQREDELKTLDPSLHALKQQIWAEQDLTKAREEATSKLEAALGKLKAEDFATSYDFRKAIGLTKIRGFDSGGYHPGGMRLVGESGPEIEWTGPSRILSNAQSQNLLGGGELVAEVRALREELSHLGIQTVVNTGKTAKLMDRWDGDGLPNSRDELTTWGN